MLVVAFCILKKCILRFGFDEHVSDEVGLMANDTNSGHGVEQFDN
jgi:hypothetical protein